MPGPSEMKHQEYEWQISSKVKETHDTYAYTLLPVSESQRFDFEIGQFVTLSAFLIRPTTSGKSDSFAAYFNEQVKLGDRFKLKLNPNKEHFLWKVAAGIEKNVAYWSGANGAESARGLIQYMEDKNDPEFNLVLFYSNTKLSVDNAKKDFNSTEHHPVDTLNVIYYNWLIDITKKIENLKVIFTFTREQEVPITSPQDARIIYRKGRFFLNLDGSPERTLLKYGGKVEALFNPICGSSSFINGTVMLPNGKINKGKGILQNLVELEGIKPEKIDKEQFYLQQVGANQQEEK